jgi:septal ring factor EnvC (AmiA/AmiB activator)
MGEVRGALRKTHIASWAANSVAQMNPRTALILAGLALVVGVVGLVIGISAKNGNKSDQDIADATKAQLEQQLGTTASEVKGAQAAQATKQADVTASVNKQLHSLRTSVDAIQNSVNSLNTTTATQGTNIKNLQDDVNKLDTKVSNLGG